MSSRDGPSKVLENVDYPRENKFFLGLWPSATDKKLSQSINILYQSEELLAFDLFLKIVQHWPNFIYFQFSV